MLGLKICLFYFRDVAMKALNTTGQNHISMNALYQVQYMSKSVIYF